MKVLVSDPCVNQPSETGSRGSYSPQHLRGGGRVGGDEPVQSPGGALRCGQTPGALGVQIRLAASLKKGLPFLVDLLRSA